jgi:hypothetical protein
MHQRSLGIAVSVSLGLVSGCGDSTDNPDFGTGESASATDGSASASATGSTTGASDTASGGQTTGASDSDSGTTATAGTTTATATSGGTTQGSTGGASSTGASTTGGSTGGVTAGSTSGASGGSTSGGSTSGGSTSGGTTAAGSTGGQPPKMCAPVVPGIEMCMAPGDHIVCDDDDDPFHAIGLNCPGVPGNSTPIYNEILTANDDETWYTITQFGSSNLWQPKEGNRMLIMSTGTLDAPDGNGVLTQAAGVTENLFVGMNRNKTKNMDNQQLPAPMNAVDGSGGTPFMDCDCVNDCSDTLEAQWDLGENKANDLIWFRFDLAVPAGTYGYEFDFAWFSSEYPEWVGSKYNDVFVVWSTSETYTGNITFINDQPLTVTALENEMQYKENSNQLDGTGFEGVGGATGWFTAQGSVAPGELFTLAWAVFDMGDEVLDTAILVDNFKWTCEGCKPEEDGCGIIPQ